MKQWEWRNSRETESVLEAYPLSVCSCFKKKKIIFHFLFLLFLWERERERDAPLSEIAEVVQSSHLTGPKHSLCCCECQSKRSAWQGLPWVTLHRLVRACEMDNSLGGLSGLMTRFPGICAAVPWPGSPSKELCYGAVLPLYCYCYDRYGSTGG